MDYSIRDRTLGEDIDPEVSLFVSPSTSTSSEAFHPQQSPSRPRLLSPRLLRGAFVDANNNPPPTLPPPVNYQDTLRDVEHALHNADMALRNAQAAFREGRLAHANSNGNNEVVDLTATSDDIEDNMIAAARMRSSQRERQARPQNGPTLAELLLAARNTQPPSRNLPLPPVRSFFEPNINLQPPPHYTMQRSVTADEQAIRRQRLARREWTRNQHLLRRRWAREAAEAGTAAPQLRNDLPRGDDFRATSIVPDSQSPSEMSSIQSSNSSAESLVDSQHPYPVRSAALRTETQDRLRMNGNTIDLTEVDDPATLNNILSRSQQSPKTIEPQEKSKSTFANYKCAICMDSPKDATTTICGHMFCHKCIIDSLRWSERTRREEVGTRGRVNGLCPVCRKPLQSKDATSTSKSAGGLVTLEIKTMNRAQYNNRKNQKEFFDSLKDKENEVEPVSKDQAVDLHQVLSSEYDSDSDSWRRSFRRRFRTRPDSPRPDSSRPGRSVGIARRVGVDHHSLFDDTD